MSKVSSAESALLVEEFVCRQCNTLLVNEEICVNCGSKDVEVQCLTPGVRRAKLAWRTMRLNYKREVEKTAAVAPIMIDRTLLSQQINQLNEGVGKLLCYNALLAAVPVLLSGGTEKKEVIALTFPGTSNQFETSLQILTKQRGVPCTLKLVERNVAVHFKQRELFKDRENTTLFLTDLGRAEMVSVSKWDSANKRMVPATNAEIMEWPNLVWLDFMSGLSQLNLLTISTCFKFNRNTTWLFAVTYGTRHNQVANVDNTLTKIANRFRLIINPLIGIRYESSGGVRMCFVMYRMNRVKIGVDV